MKKILFLVGVLPLLTMTGCLIAEGGGHGHRRHGHATIIAPAPVVVVPLVPVVRVYH